MKIFSRQNKFNFMLTNVSESRLLNFATNEKNVATAVEAALKNKEDGGSSLEERANLGDLTGEELTKEAEKIASSLLAESESSAKSKTEKLKHTLSSLVEELGITLSSENKSLIESAYKTYEKKVIDAQKVYDERLRDIDKKSKYGGSGGIDFFNLDDIKGAPDGSETKKAYQEWKVVKDKLSSAEEKNNKEPAEPQKIVGEQEISDLKQELAKKVTEIRQAVEKDRDAVHAEGGENIQGAFKNVFNEHQEGKRDEKAIKGLVESYGDTFPDGFDVDNPELSEEQLKKGEASFNEIKSKLSNKNPKKPFGDWGELVSGLTDEAKEEFGELNVGRQKKMLQLFNQEILWNNAREFLKERSDILESSSEPEKKAEETQGEVKKELTVVGGAQESQVKKAEKIQKKSNDTEEAVAIEKKDKKKDKAKNIVEQGEWGNTAQNEKAVKIAEEKGVKHTVQSGESLGAIISGMKKGASKSELSNLNIWGLDVVYKFGDSTSEPIKLAQAGKVWAGNKVSVEGGKVVVELSNENEKASVAKKTTWEKTPSNKENVEKRLVFEKAKTADLAKPTKPDTDTAKPEAEKAEAEKAEAETKEKNPAKAEDTDTDTAKPDTAKPVAAKAETVTSGYNESKEGEYKKDLLERIEDKNYDFNGFSGPEARARERFVGVVLKTCKDENINPDNLDISKFLGERGKNINYSDHDKEGDEDLESRFDTWIKVKKNVNKETEASGYDELEKEDYKENLLERIEDKNYDFNGVGTLETSARERFVGVVLKTCKTKNINPDNLDISKFLGERGKNINYSGDSYDKGENKVLEDKLGTWLDTKK